MPNPVWALSPGTIQKQNAADRCDDRKADWLWQQVVGNEPANIGDGPHGATDEGRQDHFGINTRLVLHCDTVDEHEDCAGDDDPGEMSKHVVHTYTYATSH